VLLGLARHYLKPGPRGGDTERTVIGFMDDELASLNIRYAYIPVDKVLSGT
jgi:hypothetical protein